MIGESNYETNFPHNFLVEDRQVSKLRKCFANNLSTDIKLLKTQIPKIVKTGGFLDRLF